MGRLKHPQLWLGIINIVWGVTGLSFAFLTSSWQFLTCRLVLGAAEAGSFPAYWYYTSLFVPNSKVTMAVATVDVAICLAQALSAPAALLLFKLRGVWGLYAWQWLFIAEGIPAVLLGLVMFMALPSNPRSIKRLSPSEQAALLKALELERTEPIAPGVPVRRKLAIMLRNWKLQYVTAVSLLRHVAQASFLYFVPILVEEVLAGTHDLNSIPPE